MTPPSHDLIARVEGLAGVADTLTAIEIAQYAQDIVGVFPASYLREAIEGSLDAAERFRKAMLPKSSLEIVIDARAHASICVGTESFYCLHPLAPHAIIIAVLRAMTAKEGE